MIEDHQLVAMTQQYHVDRQGEYVCYEAYEIINEQVRNGRPWAKCRDCGNPFPLDKPGATGSMCSEKCERAYAHYLSVYRW